MALTDSTVAPPPGSFGGGVNPESARELLTSIVVSFSVSGNVLDQVTPMEIVLAESLLTPGLQTSVKCHSYFHNIPIKNLNQFKGCKVNIQATRAINEKYGVPTSLKVSQTVYRLGCFNKAGRPGERKLINNNIEEFTLQACDHTLLTDAETIVNKAWKCTPPSAIVGEMLGLCVGATATNVEGSCCPRDYQAENIHPFQVIDQQADAALAGGSPSFIHYMTYENGGTHKFRSLDSLCRQVPIAKFIYDEIGLAGAGYANPLSIMTHSFPCDFDLLTDALNSIGSAGDMSSVFSFNPVVRGFGFGGLQPLFGCSKATIVKNIMSNMGSEGSQFSCPDYAPYVAQKRKARMHLIDTDKIALMMTVPFHPGLHAGKVIRLELRNKKQPTALNYGSGNYLIHSMTHNLKFGGFSTTIVECVSTTVGGGIV